ncbi:hypothetical protein DAI22_01g042000 [Oryza sativa Japonica Group]|nr:hypothetical protein DAI22_01g042000 [Oryza sativa Japonica Group]
MAASTTSATAGAMEGETTAGSFSGRAAWAVETRIRPTSTTDTSATLMLAAFPMRERPLLLRPI